MDTYLRLPINIPAEVPPDGYIDLAYDSETGTLSITDSHNNKRHLAELDSSNEVVSAAFISDSETATLTMNASLPGFIYKGSGWTSTSLFIFAESFPEGDSVVMMKGGLMAVTPDAAYANDGAAATGGVAVGEIYFTGTKFRTRMS